MLPVFRSLPELHLASAGLTRGRRTRASAVRVTDKLEDAGQTRQIHDHNRQHCHRRSVRHSLQPGGSPAVSRPRSADTQKTANRTDIGECGPDSGAWVCPTPLRNLSELSEGICQAAFLS
jgi:hypothetical protein